MIANSGALGLDWRALDLSDYLEALEANNASHDDSKRDTDPQALARVMAARLGDGGNLRPAPRIARSQGAPRGRD